MKVISFALMVAIALGCADQATSPDTAALALKPSSGVVNSSPSSARTYRITIENLTSSQPLSPGVVVTHAKDEALFGVGDAATEGLRLIAENGDPSVALTDLGMIDGVSQVVNTGAPVGCVDCPGPFGNTLSLEVEAQANANRFSLAVMLICTNDGFAGLDGAALPTGFGAQTYLANAYDAGTEANSETWTSLVDPCGAIGPVAGPADGSNDREATADAVVEHAGIAGNGDLTAEHAWNGAVARVTVQRIK